MEQVVLLDESGHANGVMDKASVHHRETPLHLAFSCYVFNPRGELLLTQRAYGKKTWPGVWTNTCCGHPAPGESMREAVRRRLDEELGIEVGPVELVLPRFRYRAMMDNGIIENEMCPVFRTVTDRSPTPNSDEVAGTQWIDWRAFADQVVSQATDVSPWCRQQVAELAELGDEPRRWPVGTDEELPAAAR